MQNINQAPAASIKADTTPFPHRIPKYLPVFIWGLGCAFYFYEFLLQISPGIMKNDLMRDFSVTAQSLGILSGVWYWSYALLQIPSGMLIDRFGPQRILTFATVICSLGTLLFGLAPNLIIATIGRFFVGFGSAFAVIGTFKLAANWFPANRFALLAGATVALGMTGAIFAEGPLGFLINAITWRHSMILFGIIGLVLAVLLKFTVHDTPSAWIAQKNNKMPPPLPIEAKTKSAFSSTLITTFTDLWAIIKHKQIWLVAIYAGLMFFPTLTFCGLWGPGFISEHYGVEQTAAGGVVSLVFVGWIFGGPLGGWFSDRIGRRLPPMYIGCIGTLIVSLIILYVPISLSVMSFLLFLFGFFSSGFLPGFSIVKESSPPEQTATALGFMNMMNSIGPAFIQPLVGFILDYLWNKEMLNGVPHYSLIDYKIALSVIPVGLLLALLTLPFIRETYCGSAINRH